MSQSTPVISPFLSTLTLKVRSRTVGWEAYHRAGYLSADDLALVLRVAASKSQAEPILAAEGAAYAELYLRLLAIAKTDAQQSALVLIGDMIADHDDRIPLFLAASTSPYSPLLKLLDSQDDFTRLKSSVFISTFIASDPAPPEPVVSKLLSHLSGLIRNTSDSEGQDIGVQSLEGILATEHVRAAAWAAEEKDAADAPKIVEGLVHLLRTNPGSQMQYQLAFCFWLLTFDIPIAASINHKYNIIPLLADLARNALKEKVIRVVVATFRNLVTKAPAQNLAAMLVAKLLPFVQSLATRKWSDDEVKEDVEFLVEELRTSFEGLTTYDEYTSELESGQLSWSPPHKNDDFWRDNASKLNDKDRKMLKVLVDLLITSKDPIVLAVAANDIAKYAKFCEVGKKSLVHLGAKARVMELMGHPDPDVKYQSLVATQVLLSSGFKA